MDDIERLIVGIIDSRAAELVAFGKDILAHPEEGYLESYTSARARDALAGLGLKTREGLAMTGVRADLGEGGPCAAIIGELDAVRCSSHPMANPETGMAHACGHNLQLTGLFGAAMALTDARVRGALGGRVAFMAAPAEEYGSMEFKEKLFREGKLRFSSGKSELLRTGAFDDVGLAITHHVHFKPYPRALLMGGMTCNGAFVKRVTFHGKASHAGVAPHLGVNALSAANLALAAIGLLREGFNPDDGLRAHSIITAGGDVVNIIPSNVVMELQGRALNIAALSELAEKLDRALRAGALAMGGTVTVENLPGYLPMRHFDALPCQRAIAEALTGGDWGEVPAGETHGACTDVGDLSQLMPIVNFTTGGVSGALHTADFKVSDERTAYLLPAKVMALTAYNLMKDGGSEAKRLIDGYDAPLTLESYKALMEGMRARDDFDDLTPRARQ